MILVVLFFRAWQSMLIAVMLNCYGKWERQSELWASYSFKIEIVCVFSLPLMFTFSKSIFRWKNEHRPHFVVYHWLSSQEWRRTLRGTAEWRAAQVIRAGVHGSPRLCILDNSSRLPSRSSLTTFSTVQMSRFLCLFLIFWMTLSKPFFHKGTLKKTNYSLRFIL